MTQATISLIILLATAVLMVVDIIPTSVVAIIGALACGFTGLIDKSELLATLGTETMITLIGLSIVGSAMFKTGLANRMARSILKVSGKNENGVYIASMVIGTLLSAVASNTAVVITMIPLIMSMCQKVKVSPSRILYPMVAACSFGSALTLIGTPSNIAGNSVLAKFGLPSMGFFDVAWVGVPLTVVGFIYMMTLGKITLPKDEYVEDETAIQNLDAIEPWNKKAVLTAVICAVTLVVMVIQPSFLPLSTTALCGAVILIVTRCISEKDAYHSIDFSTMLLFTGLMTITTAVNASGGGNMLAQGIMKLIGNNTNPYFLTAMLGIVCLVLTSFISNTAAVMIMGTVAVYVAQAVGANPFTMVMVVVISANACFATPIGGIAYTIVMKPGHYKFKDFFKMGWPLALINLILAIIIIPLVWSF